MYSPRGKRKKEEDEEEKRKKKKQKNGEKLWKDPHTQFGLNHKQQILPQTYVPPQ